MWCDDHGADEHRRRQSRLAERDMSGPMEFGLATKEGRVGKCILEGREREQWQDVIRNKTLKAGAWKEGFISLLSVQNCRVEEFKKIIDVKDKREKPKVTMDTGLQATSCQTHYSQT